MTREELLNRSDFNGFITQGFQDDFGIELLKILNNEINFIYQNEITDRTFIDFLDKSIDKDFHIID